MACRVCGSEDHDLRTCTASAAAAARTKRIENTAKNLPKTRKCGFCKEVGHTISTCTKDGVEEEKNKRRNKAQIAAEKKTQNKINNYQIKETPIELPRPEKVGGRLVSDYIDQCKSVKGSIDIILTNKLLNKILEIVNKNLVQYSNNNNTYGRITKCRKLSFNSQITQKKNIPVPADGSLLEIKKIKNVKYVQSTRNKRKRKLEPRFTTPFKIEELKKFISILLFIATKTKGPIHTLWNTKADMHNGYFQCIRNLMSRERFQLLYKNFFFSDELEKEIELIIDERIEKIWISSNYVCIDEAIVPFKGRGNPHHVFIMRKPHPHGVKFWTTVDLSGYIIKMSMYRRNKSPEKASETLVRMSKNLKADTVILADSYFGGITSLEALCLESKHCILSCSSTRPSYLFRNNISKKLIKDGDNISLYGRVKIINSTPVPFLANGCMSLKRKLHTLSTVFSSNEELVNIRALIDDNTEENQSMFQETVEYRSEVRIEYSQNMDYNDKANGATLVGYPPNKKFHFSSAVMMWMLSALLIVNCKRVYMSANNISKLDNSKWIPEVRKSLNGLSDHIIDEHFISKGNSVSRCKCCLMFPYKSQGKTTLRCRSCGLICKSCLANNLHKKFYTSISNDRTSTRRSYS